MIHHHLPSIKYCLIALFVIERHFRRGVLARESLGNGRGLYIQLFIGINHDVLSSFNENLNYQNHISRFL